MCIRDRITQVQLLARLQVRGVDISGTSLSLLEGQKRPVFDYELAALADILKVDVNWLLGRQEEKYGGKETDD